MNAEQVVKNIRNEFKNYMQNTDRKSVVLGVSGGIDSALIAALVKPVCDEIGIKLLGFSLPTSSNKPEEIHRAHAIGTNFCHHFKTVQIDDSVEKIWHDLPSNGKADVVTDVKIAFGNVKARTRMIILYHSAFINKGLVLSTDNLTEYHLGFWTLHGDVGDLGLIQNLWKTEVYQISQWIVDNELKTNEEKKALQDCINCRATDGLGITEGGDLEQIGEKSYDIVDLKIKKYLETKEINSISQRCINSDFKRDNPHNISREKII